uniref:Major facilitator superfamily (MFS) profile domain-containing protein n=1 Tax=Ditylenchus dipsaci TaxID=166011 RepID=A0A915DKS8_9BILA
MENSSVKAWSEQDDSESSPSDVIQNEHSESVINLESDPLTNDGISFDEMDAEDEEGKKVLQGRMTCCLLFASIAASLSSLQYGYHLGVVNSPASIMKDWYKVSFFRLHGVHISDTMTDVLWATSVSIYAFGAIFGGLVTGWLADNIGRKKTLLLNNILVFVSTALTSSAKYVDVLYLIIIGRLIIGFNCGINSNLVPLYLTEIAPINYRGTVGTLHQLAIVFSIGAALVMGLPYIFGNELLWPMLFVTALVPAVLQLLSLTFCPESPKFTIVMKGNDNQAEKDLRRLRGKCDVSKELAKIKEEAAVAKAQPKVSYCDMFRAKYRWPLAIALILVISRQLAGINAISFYSTSIFDQAGLKGKLPALASAGLGVVMVLVTIFSAFMVDSKCCGRRPLLLSGLAGCCLSLVLLTVSMSFAKSLESIVLQTWAGYCSVAFVVLFIIMWSWGIGPVPWFYVTELFHYNARGRASSLASMSNWTSTFIIGLSYPPLNDWLRQYTFLIYAAISAATFVFTLLAVPETKGKTTDEILHEIKSNPLHKVATRFKIKERLMLDVGGSAGRKGGGKQPKL